MPRWIALIVLAGKVIGAVPLGAQEDPGVRERWRIDLSPYAWLTGLDGRTTVDSEVTDVSLAFDDVLDLTDSGFQMLAAARKGDWTIAADLTLAGLGIEETGELIAVDVDMDQVILAVKAGYRVLTRPAERDPVRSLPRNHGLDVQIGVRYWDLGFEARVVFDLLPPGTIPPELLVNGDDRWADLLLGAAYAAPLSGRVSIGATVNLGGFGIGSSSRFTWEATLMFTRVATGHWAFSGGYRGLFWDRTSSSGGSRTRNEITLHGPVIGATYRF